ncbi:MAG: hypothetical protein OXG38_10305 [Chloroflexi bacterium]|nr:hypothetical protein [Chloroflexota bacterium]
MELHYGVPEGIELPEPGKFRRNHMAVGARMADLIDTHVGQYVACFGDDQQFAFGDDPWELIARIPEEERPTAHVQRVPPRDQILIL